MGLIDVSSVSKYSFVIYKIYFDYYVIDMVMQTYYSQHFSNRSILMKIR